MEEGSYGRLPTKADSVAVREERRQQNCGKIVASENKRALWCKEWIWGVSWRSSESHTHVFEDRMGIDSDGALT